MNLDTATDDARPTLASTAAVVLVSVAAAAVLVRRAGVGAPAALGAAGAVLAAVLVWGAAHERRTAGSVVAALLVVPVGGGVVAATAGTLLVLSGTLFPVPSTEALAGTVVQMVAQAMVVLGGVTAVFGAAVATRGVLTREAVERATGVALKTTVVPLGIGLLGLVAEVLSLLAANPEVPGAGRVVGDAVSGITEAVLYPPPARPHLATFLLLVGAATYLAAKAVAALPLTELLPEEDDRDPAAAVERTQRRAAATGLATAAPVPVVGLVEFALGAGGMRSLLPEVLFALLTGLTTAPGLRSLAWWVALLGLGVVLSVRGLRRVVQASTDRIGSAVAPFVVGALAAVLASALAGPLVEGAVAWVTEKLPGAIGEQFNEIATGTVDTFGATTITLTAVGVVGLATAGVLALTWLMMLTGYVEDRTAGVTVASVNLFSAAAFAGVLGVDPVVVLAALVAAVVVWDVGEFGTTLGEEVGRRAATRRTELVHAGGTLAVGGVGAGAALAIGGAGLSTVTVSGGALVLGLLAVVTGLLLLVMALR